MTNDRKGVEDRVERMSLWASDREYETHLTRDGDGWDLQEGVYDDQGYVESPVEETHTHITSLERAVADYVATYMTIEATEVVGLDAAEFREWLIPLLASHQDVVEINGTEFSAFDEEED